MSSTPSEQSPTQGQNANTVGKFYSLTPAKFASPAEYKKAKDKAYDEWRDSLKTSDDYNNAARDLLGQQTAGDRYQQYNVRDGLATIQNDAQANGVKLAPDVEQGLGEYSLGELGRIGTAFAEGYGGRGRGRRPGEGKKQPKEEENPKKKDDNVQVRSKKKQQGMDKVSKGNFHPSTDPNKRPPSLWSGPRAKAAAAEDGRGTLTDTAGGRDLEDFINKNPDLTPQEKRQLWAHASPKYAKAAVEANGGNPVPAYLDGPLHMDSILAQQEVGAVSDAGGSIDFKSVK
jgi:hypothetical protein